MEKRRRFARECVGLIQDYGFDGIDIGKLLIGIAWLECIVCV